MSRGRARTALSRIKSFCPIRVRKEKEIDQKRDKGRERHKRNSLLERERKVTIDKDNQNSMLNVIYIFILVGGDDRDQEVP